MYVCNITYMKAYVHLYYLHEGLYTFVLLFTLIILNVKIISEKTVEKIKPHTLCLITLFRKSCLLRDNV